MRLRSLLTSCCALAQVIVALNGFVNAQISSEQSTSDARIGQDPALIDVQSDAKSDISVSELRIGPGDLLEIKVYGAPDLSGILRVSSTGEITFPLLGAVKVASLTPEDAQKTIEQRLVSGRLVRDPHVNVLVKEFASQGISVIGEVAHPGIYPLLGSPRLFDALSAAGGTTNRAGRMVYIIHREHPSSGQAIFLSTDFTQIVQQNVFLKPGDTVMVSRAGIIYVSGDVKTPGGYVMNSDENLTVLQALALAQGLNPTASTKNVRIIRRNAGELKQIPVELKQIMAAKAPDIRLESEDVLFVPNSASKSAARRSLESIVQVATGMAIYRR